MEQYKLVHRSQLALPIVLKSQSPQQTFKFTLIRTHKLPSLILQAKIKNPKINRNVFFYTNIRLH